MNFIEELKNLQDSKKIVAEKIKSPNLPVIIFGAAQMAKNVTERLQSFGVEISGYAVDEKYFKPNQTYLGLPIFNFDELRKNPKNYVFILGMGYKIDGGKRCSEFMNDAEIIHYAFGLDKVEAVSKKYILDNQEKFVETYNLLSDDFSRKTFVNYLKAHIADDTKYLQKIFVPDEYYNDLTYSICCNRGGGV